MATTLIEFCERTRKLRTTSIREFIFNCLASLPILLVIDTTFSGSGNLPTVWEYHKPTSFDTITCTILGSTNPSVLYIVTVFVKR